MVAIRTAGLVAFLWVAAIACGSVADEPDANTSSSDAGSTVDAGGGADAADTPVYALTITTDGSGSGTVTSDPAGISCGATCTADFADNTMVTLTAAPDGDSSFTGWSGGGCTGTDPCVVTVTAATTVNATFDDCAPGSVTFNFTGAAQSFTVPNCVSSITIDANGAEGGLGVGAGGLGGRAQGVAAVTGGEELVVMVGGAGLAAPSTGNAAGFRGGFNGGGDVFEYIGWTSQTEGLSGTGGGASDVRRGGAELANRIIVAGGGGGGGSDIGAAGGGLTGGTAPSTGGNFQGGGGGTQTEGGTAFQCCGATYPNEAGTLGQGGAAYRDAQGSGGGGGGYYGGGGGSFNGGGGGSSYIDGLTDATTTMGVNAGNGSVTISW